MFSVQNRTILKDSRSSLRIKDNTKILWSIRNGDTQGRGRVRDISTSGMQFELTADELPDHGSLLSFTATRDKLTHIPQTGRIVWHKKKRFSRNRLTCGIEFVEPSENVLVRLREKVQTKIKSLTTERYVKKGIDVLIVFVILALTAYVLVVSAEIYKNLTLSNTRMMGVTDKQASLTRNYLSLYQQTELKLSVVSEELSSSKAALTKVSKELQASQLILTQTEKMLSRIRTGNTQLQSEMEALKEDQVAQLKVLGDSITGLQNENARLTQELNAIQTKMKYYAGDIKDTEEGRALLELYRQRVRLVHTKIKGFQKEASRIRVAAQQERDRARLILGNNGYFVKAGKTVTVDEEKYQTATLDQTSPQNVQIDVTFVE